MAAYTTIDNPELYFQAKTYSGTGSEQAITLDGSEDMQPDLVWVKCRSNAENHVVHDSIRGATKVIHSDTTDAEYTVAQGLKSFGSDGFTLGTSNFMNQSGRTFVAWCWKAGGGSGSANTDGGINTTSTSVSQTAGFSISTWTGTGSTATVGTGLNAVPKMIITKARSHTYDWYTYHASIGNTKAIYLNLTNAESGASANFWNNTTPTSSVWTAGGNVFNDTYTFVTYAFAEKQGFSKFAKFTGNGNVDGPFVYTGFRPAMVMCKRTDSTGSWYICDIKRVGFNGRPNNTASVGNPELAAQSNRSEAGGNTNVMDIFSNGFKLIQSGAEINASGGTFIFMAFADSPFTNSSGVPNNAR